MVTQRAEYPKYLDDVGVTTYDPMTGAILYRNDDANDRLLHKQQSLGMAGVGPSPTIWKQYLDSQKDTKKRNAETAELGEQDSHLYVHRMVPYGSQLINPTGMDDNIIGGTQDLYEDDVEPDNDSQKHQARLDRMSDALQLRGSNTIGAKITPLAKGKAKKTAAAKPTGGCLFVFLFMGWMPVI